MQFPADGFLHIHIPFAVGLEKLPLLRRMAGEVPRQTDGEVEELLRLRLLMAKTSVKKYEAMERSVCSDGRVHGLLQFYGANRTGRFAGRLVQTRRIPGQVPLISLSAGAGSLS